MLNRSWTNEQQQFHYYYYNSCGYAMRSLIGKFTCWLDGYQENKYNFHESRKVKKKTKTERKSKWEKKNEKQKTKNINGKPISWDYCIIISVAQKIKWKTCSENFNSFILNSR